MRKTETKCFHTYNIEGIMLAVLTKTADINNMNCPFFALGFYCILSIPLIECSKEEQSAILFCGDRM